MKLAASINWLVVLRAFPDEWRTVPQIKASIAGRPLAQIPVLWGKGYIEQTTWNGTESYRRTELGRQMAAMATP